MAAFAGAAFTEAASAPALCAAAPLKKAASASAPAAFRTPHCRSVIASWRPSAKTCPAPSSGRHGALPAVEGEDEHRVTPLEVELRVAARGDCDVLASAHRVAHGRCVHARAALEAPQLLAGLRIEGLECAVAFAVEDE